MLVWRILYQTNQYSPNWYFSLFSLPRYCSDIVKKFFIGSLWELNVLTTITIDCVANTVLFPRQILKCWSSSLGKSQFYHPLPLKYTLGLQVPLVKKIALLLQNHKFYWYNEWLSSFLVQEQFSTTWMRILLTICKLWFQGVMENLIQYVKKLLQQSTKPTKWIIIWIIFTW